jgi:pimeloyl-ACP methyl ester carboxylesterase
MIERRSVVVDDVRISYLEHGSARPGATSLVLLHGLIATAETFVHLMERLGVDRHVIAIDLPGAGESERLAGGDASLISMARAVESVLGRLELERPVLLGHSHGGAVALQLASLSPQSVSGLVLMCPAHPFFSHADLLIRFYLSPAGKAFAYALPWFPRWVQLAGFRRMAGPGSWTDPKTLEPYRANLQARGTVPHLLRLLGTWHVDFDGLGQSLAGRLSIPTLLLWGDKDRAVPSSTAEVLCMHLDNAELQVFEGIGHRPAEEVPERCAEAVEVWLSALARA